MNYYLSSYDTAIKKQNRQNYPRPVYGCRNSVWVSLHEAGRGFLFMNEEWKAITGYEGIYEVSNSGRIKSLARTVFSKSGIGKGSNRALPERIMRTTILKRKGQYPAVHLKKNSKRKAVAIHRLVFNAFVSNPDNLPEVNHKDGDKRNNNASNLEPSTRQHNCQHAVENGLLKIRGEDNYFAKLDRADVEAIRLRFANGESQTAIARTTGFPLANVHCIVRRKSWRHLPDRSARVSDEDVPQ